MASSNPNTLGAGSKGERRCVCLPRIDPGPPRTSLRPWGRSLSSNVSPETGPSAVCLLVLHRILTVTLVY